MSTTPAITIPFTFEVIAGCRDLSIRKGYRAVGRFSEQGDFGVLLETSSKLGNGRGLYISGTRKYIPTLTKGATFNLHAGDPTRRITIKILSVSGT